MYLAPSTLYHIRAYATNSVGTAYGPELTFTTLAPPSGLATVSTAAVAAITQNSATGGGNVSQDGGSPILQRGVCWATTQEPTISGSKAIATGTTGAFTVALSSLVPATTYYARAYATNANGTSYGSQVTFTTTAVPSGPAPQGGSAVCNGT